MEGHPFQSGLQVRGFFLRMTRCRVWDFHADKPEFLDADKNLKANKNQTDNRRKDSYKTLAHSEQIHSERRYLSTHFFVDLIRFISR